MQRQNINRNWQFIRGTQMIQQAMRGGYGETVNLPHDYMIESEVKADAPAGSAMGYYTEGVATYTKILEIPLEWKGENIYLHFDGVMLNASVYVNGSLAKLHHYGYTPFTVDITNLVYYGENNRISVIVNPSMQPNSRWYTGAGIYRSVELSHVNPIHVEPHGIFAYTKSLEADGSEAGIITEVTVRNNKSEDHQIRVRTKFMECGSNGNKIVTRDSVLLVKAKETSVARIPTTVDTPNLWSAETPNLYKIEVEVIDMGEFSVALQKIEETLCDTAETTFGIRTISADTTHGLRVNGKSVKLKGACIHHDNGLLGAVSVYDCEYRKLKKLKESGYNAIRLSHNPPSTVFMDLCDELGMYVFNEAFDAWGHYKQPGDYSQFFADHWKDDMKAFITRDRNHPSILFWSTGNEVEERGGMGDGYAVAEKLAAYVRTLDSTRLITNGLCSMWSGLDDKENMKNFMKIKEAVAAGSLQNLDISGKNDIAWEERTESFTNCLDVVGYNYMDNHYTIAAERYPERVILGTESYPNQADLVWQQVEDQSHVIGDFVWTGYDYIGEAGIGKSSFFAPDVPDLQMGLFALSSHVSEYPWRLANCADYTITGHILPQGIFRKILWGSAETGLYVQNPVNFGLTEMVSSWGWNEMSSNWNWPGYEGKQIKVYVYSQAKEVELYQNGVSLGKKPAGKENRYTAEFQLTYVSGILEAVSLQDGKEISRATLKTSGSPAAVRLTPEKTTIFANGESLAYVLVEIVDEEGCVVTNTEVSLTAEVISKGTEEVTAYLAAAGSDNPVTEDNYTSGKFKSYRGYGTIILRAGYEAGEAELKVTAEGMDTASITIQVKK